MESEVAVDRIRRVLAEARLTSLARLRGAEARLRTGLSKPAVVAILAAPGVYRGRQEASPRPAGSGASAQGLVPSRLTRRPLKWTSLATTTLNDFKLAVYETALFGNLRLIIKTRRRICQIIQKTPIAFGGQIVTRPPCHRSRSIPFFKLSVVTKASIRQSKCHITLRPSPLERRSPARPSCLVSILDSTSPTSTRH